MTDCVAPHAHAGVFSIPLHATLAFEQTGITAHSEPFVVAASAARAYAEDLIVHLFSQRPRCLPNHLAFQRTDAPNPCFHAPCDCFKDLFIRKRITPERGNSRGAYYSLSEVTPELIIMKTLIRA